MIIVEGTLFSLNDKDITRESFAARHFSTAYEYLLQTSSKHTHILTRRETRTLLNKHYNTTPFHSSFPPSPSK